MIKRTFSIILILFILVATLPANFSTIKILALESSALHINEVNAKNTGANGNLKEHTNSEDEFADWVELYNNSDKDINISGFGFSDDKTNSFKYKFPANTVVKAKDYLIIFCSKVKDPNNNGLIADFGLSTDGETLILSNLSGEAVDTLTYDSLEDDQTFGHFPDASGTLVYLNPTPRQNNTVSSVKKPLKPIFSKETGVYKDSFTLELTSPTKDAQIYYTTDGTNPLKSSTAILYTGPFTVKDRTGEPNIFAGVDTRLISVSQKLSKNPASIPTASQVDKGTIVTAVCVFAQQSSKVETKTYLVGSKTSSYGKISILSVTADYDDFFDYNKGIYVAGKRWDEFSKEKPGVTEPWLLQANYTNRGREWERNAHFDLIDQNGKYQYSSDCGVRVAGGGSRDNMQKSMRFFARSEYGNKYFEYPIFENGYDYKGKVIDRYKSFMIRAGGNETDFLKITDHFVQNRVKNTAAETQTGKPCLVFLNGEYWGFYILQQDYSAEHFAEKYDVDKDEVIIIKKDKLEEGVESDINLYKEMTDFIINGQMSNSENYKKASDLIDIQSYIDYMATQVYINNVDWPGNNFLLWRTRTVDPNKPYADGRWRFALYDTEYSMWLYGNANTRYDVDNIRGILLAQSNQGQSKLGKMAFSLQTNYEFKQRFVKAFVQISNINFNSEEAFSQYNNFYETNKLHLLAYEKRFYNRNYINQSGRIGHAKTFLKSRQFYALDYLNSSFRLNSTVYPVYLSSNSPNYGKVILDDQFIDLSNFNSYKISLRYFSKTALTFKAEPNKGYKFTGWTGTVTSNNLQETINVDRSYSMKANFAKIKYGDCNLDGIVNAKDVLALRKHLAGFNNNLAADEADTHNDSKVNAKDVLMIRKHLVNSSVVLG